MGNLDELKRDSAGDNTHWIFLSELLGVLWRARKPIVGGAILAVMLGGALAWSAAQYKSEGFLQFGGVIPMSREKSDQDTSQGILLADYKRYAALFNTSGRFDEFVQQNKMAGVAAVGQLRRVFVSNELISSILDPVYSYTKVDAKELMAQPKDGGNNVIGLRIKYETGNPQDAQSMVGLLGRYAMDSIIYLIYSDALRFKHAEITAKISKLDNDIIELKENLEKYRRKGVTLKQIVAQYPESSKQAVSQVLSVTEENSRYLSPVTHLMSNEVDTLNASEGIVRLKREQQQNLLLLEYFDRAKALLDANKSGESILRELDKIKESVFKDKDLTNEVVKEVYNQISIENQTAVNVYLEKTRFIAGPSFPERRSSRLGPALILSMMIGLLISSILVLAYHWRQNVIRKKSA
ncbi:hypothetical protein [Janthinobacterium agaricidamnosum]|uniref:Chain length determinant family protein n=1 Tax=Janthinobacterium agaricidamnosum NBRC 102515 = DSM 9628 TaxID=1349767 RepID=W0V2M7_9BURK|nr:hypothetical protein [Janthinobacterium agaricidamnosum]CDG81603.1 hypothetical protein GJA_947 [Janthinobacterium agaricidamnosum NBRC 102515 = DSM 9628]